MLPIAFLAGIVGDLLQRVPGRRTGVGDRCARGGSALIAAILATGASDSLLVAQCVCGACLLVSMVASLAGVGVRLATTLPTVGVLLVVGWSTAVIGLVVGRLDVIVLGTVIGVAGQAVGTIGGAVVTGLVYAVVAAVAIGLVVRRDRASAGAQSSPTSAMKGQNRRVAGTVS